MVSPLAASETRDMTLFRQFMRFATAGAVGTSIQYLLLFVLVESFALNAVFASSLGFLAGAAANFLLGHNWVFRSPLRYRDTVLQFAAVAGVGLLLNALLMYLAVDLIGLHYLLAQLCATGLVLIWNFLGNRMWTFAYGEKGNG